MHAGIQLESRYTKVTASCQEAYLSEESSFDCNFLVFGLRLCVDHRRVFVLGAMSTTGYQERGTILDGRSKDL